MNMDELQEALRVRGRELEIESRKSALLLVDMQRMAGSDYLLMEARGKGIPEESIKEALVEMDQRVNGVLQNAARILNACREKGIQPIHVKIEAETPNGRDVGRLHKLINFVVPPGSKWAEFFDEVKPVDGEIVLKKTCSGAFVGTHIDRILRNLEVETLIIVGFYTEQCVETAARDAADSGYDTILVEDACGTLTEELHDNSIKALRDLYVTVKTTDEIVGTIMALS